VDQPAPSDSSRPGTGLSARVLLALTEPDESQHCGKFLRARDLQVVETSDGIDALVKALSNKFDAIVADAGLPGITGPELCRVIRQDPWTRDIPFILTTKDRPTASALLAVDVVVESPIDALGLFASIREVVEARQLKTMPIRERSFPASPRHRRGPTMNPPLVPPQLICPRCDRPLSYLQSQLGGINERSAEQWDYFECSNACGTFQYRHRTRHLRPTSVRPDQAPRMSGWSE
jgi:CheY-like chemotaxis protein